MAYLRHSSQSLPAFSIQPPSSSSSSGTAETPGQSNAASSVSQTANTQSTVVASTDPVSPRTLRPSHPQATGSQRLTPDEISELPMIPDSPPPSFDEAVGLVPLSSGSHASLASLNSATQASSLGGVSRSGSLNRQRIRYNTSNASLSSQGGQGGQGGQGVRLFSLARNDSAVRDEEDEDEEDEDDGNISLTFGPRSHPTFRNHEDDRVQISAQQLRTYSNSSRRRNSGGQGQAHSRSNSRAFATPAPGPSSQQHRHSSSVSSVSSAGSVSSFLSDHSGTPLTISGSRASQPAKPPSYSASSRSSSSTNLQNFSNLHINHPHPASSSSSSTPTPTILDSGTSPETFSTLLSHLLANNSTTNTNTAPGIISSTTNPSDLIDPALLAYPTISDHLSGARRSNRRTGSFSSSMQNRNRAAFSFAQSTAAVPLASASSPSLNTLGHSASPILHHPTPIVTSSGNQSPFPFSQRQLEDISTYFEYLQQQHLKIQGQLAIEQQVTQNHTQNAPTTSNTNIGSVDNRIAQQIPAVFSTNPNDQLESHIQFLQQLHQHQQHQQLHHRHSQGNISSAPRPESSGSVASPNNQHTRSLSNTQQRENCSQNSGDAALDITPLSGGGGLHDAQNTATSTSSSTHTKPDVHRRRTVSDPISRQQELLTPNQSSASPLDPVQTPTTGPNNKGSGSWFFFSRYAYEDPQGEEQRNQQQTHLKYVGRRIFNARFHFLLGLSRVRIIVWSIRSNLKFKHY